MSNSRSTEGWKRYHDEFLKIIKRTLVQRRDIYLHPTKQAYFAEENTLTSTSAEPISKRNLSLYARKDESG